MKKFFLYAFIVIFVLLTIAPFLAGYYEPVADFLLGETEPMKNTFLLMLIAGLSAWCAGVILGFLASYLPAPVRKGVLFLPGSVRLVPSFLLSGIIVLSFEKSMPAVFLAFLAPAFLMSFEVSASSAAALHDFRYNRVVTANFGKKAYNQSYLVPFFWAPAFSALWDSFRMVLYADVCLGVLGLTDLNTLGSAVLQLPNAFGASALFISAVMISLVNGIYLLSREIGTPNKTEVTSQWLKH